MSTSFGTTPVFSHCLIFKNDLIKFCKFSEPISAECDTAESIPKKKFKKIENPFDNFSESESDDDISDDEPPIDVPLTVTSEKVLGKCGVWGETFFFKENDSRLQGKCSSFFRNSRG